jgi:peptidoglycan-N-acetylglucosamine deacetylase
MNFRNTTLLFFILLLVLNLVKLFTCPCEFLFTGFFCQYPEFFYIPLLCLYLIIPIVLSFRPCSQFHFKPVICRGETKLKEISITFDDGPDPVFSPLILDILHQKNIKATFFLIGQHITGNEGIVKAMDEAGHILGNHSYSHSNFWDFWPPFRIYRDLIKNESIIRDITGKKPNFFRPPYGVINPMVSSALRRTTFQVIAWSNWSGDTITRNPEVLIKKVTGNLKPGDIILLHDNQEITTVILEKLIEEICSNGFRVIPLDQLINKEKYA